MLVTSLSVSSVLDTENGDKNVRPRIVSFSVGNSQKLLGARSGEYGA